MIVLTAALIGFSISYFLIPVYEETGMAIGNLILRALQFSTMTIIAFYFLNSQIRKNTLRHD
jgi:hypothetical protein